jgi:hypothetical protein
VARALRYALDAIGYALALWGYAPKTAEQVRRAVSAATARGLSAPSQWSSLRRWAARGARVFGSDAPSASGTLRDRARQVATWLTARAPLPTGQVPRDAFCCDAHWLMFDRASWLMGITGSGTLSARGLMTTSGNAPAS